MMISPLYGFLLIAGFLLLMCIRMPIGFAMAVTSLLYILLTGRLMPSLVTQNMASSMTSYTVLAVPFFIVCGQIMNGVGITDKIFDFADKCMGHIRGGLGHVNVLASLIFSGMSGSANADVAGLGAIEIKAMKERGYDADFAVGVTAASSIIGPIFPPSNPMVLVGVATGTSIGALFLGGMVVGVLMALFMFVTVYMLAKKKNYYVSPKASWKERFVIFRKSFLALITPVILIWGLTAGYLTPVETGCIACAYSLFLNQVVYKQMSLKELFESIAEGMSACGLVFLMMSAAKIFSTVLADQKIAEGIAQGMFSLTANKWGVLILINLFLLFLGTFLNPTSGILIATPILFPIAKLIGMNMVQFGVIFVLNLMIGMLTPPTASVLFVASKIGGISFERGVKAILPYYIALLAVVVLINIFPGLTLGVPNLLLGGYSW